MCPTINRAHGPKQKGVSNDQPSPWTKTQPWRRLFKQSFGRTVQARYPNIMTRPPTQTPCVREVEPPKWITYFAQRSSRGRRLKIRAPTTTFAGERREVQHMYVLPRLKYCVRSCRPPHPPATAQRRGHTHNPRIDVSRGIDDPSRKHDGGFMSRAPFCHGNQHSSLWLCTGRDQRVSSPEHESSSSQGVPISHSSTFTGSIPARETQLSRRPTRRVVVQSRRTIQHSFSSRSTRAPRATPTTEMH